MAKSVDCYRPEHLGLAGEIIDVPSQRLVLTAVAFETGRKVPLGAADVEIYSLAEKDSPEPAYTNVPGPGQIEDCDIYSAV